MPENSDEFPDVPASIRGEYEARGAEAFYRERGAAYRNPHEPIVARSLSVAVGKWPLDLKWVLDLAAGSGEATLALRELGAGEVDGVDPYTFAAYQQRTGREAERFSFEQIAGGALAGRTYRLIVASFALHLCELSRLPALMYQLALIAPTLLVLTPHKQPEIRRAWGWTLVEEIVVERVRTRYYTSTLDRGDSFSERERGQ